MASPYPSEPPEVPEEEPDVIQLPRRRQDDSELDITPMIDVTFLLLIFFIVASRLDPQAAVDLPRAKHGEAVPEKSSVVIIVARGDDPDEARVFLGASKDEEKRVTGSLDDMEEQIRQYVDDGLNGAPPKKHVLIKAERGIPYRHVDHVRRAVSGAVTDQSIHVGILEQT